MTHEYDAARTAHYFSENAELYDLYANDEGPSPRDRILLEKILPKMSEVKKVVDYGCGAGGLTAELAKEGYDILGVEPNDKLRKLAAAKLQRLGYGEERLMRGSIEALAALEKQSVDLC